ncbi:hypothetical protein ACHAWO_003980 [Cyclotella atomus]|uniref:Uncharacterized protein n=1 Tax=Cyclotella atomus TaxID=382360 RepID=A0ABD3PV65_9STRA
MTLGFGFMDTYNHDPYRSCIDCTLGVTFGLSTLAAGVVFGDALENVFHRIVPVIKMSKASCNLGISNSCSLLGEITWCDTGASLLKLHALEEGKSLEVWGVEIDNEMNPECRPDVDGVIASITALLAVAALLQSYMQPCLTLKEGEVLGSNDESSTSSNNSAVESLVHLLNPPPPLVEDIF